MPRAITPTETDPSIVGDACCPRCGDDVEPVERIRNPDGDVVGFRVVHDGGKYSVSCSMREWPIFDPDALDGETGLPNNPDASGLSICRTCLGWVQHIEPDGKRESTGATIFKTVDPPRDEAGEIICPHCRARFRRQD